MRTDLYGLNRNKPPICNGTDCVNPPFDPTENGPTSAPSDKSPPDKDLGRGYFGEICDAY